MNIAEAAEILNATPADIAGLWNVPGHPELTTAQLMFLATERKTPSSIDPIAFLKELIKPAP